MYTKVKLILLVTLYVLLSGRALAQSEKISFEEFIRHVSSKYQLSFSYDAELLSHQFIAVADTATSTSEEAFSKIETVSPFQVQKLASGQLLLVPANYENVKLELLILDELQNPVPGVLVYILGCEHKTLSSYEGVANLEAFISKNDTLVIEGVGFETKKISLKEIPRGELAKVNIQTSVNTLDAVVIEAYIVPGMNAVLDDQSIEINQEELAIVPGNTAGDVLQSLSIIPGISSPNTKAGNLVVRGSTRDQTLVYFDDIPLYNKGHFLGTISPFNQLVVDEVKVYRSGSPSNIGGRVGGTIKVNTDQEVADSMRSAVGVSFADVMAYTKVPIIKNKLDILVSGRYALPNDWKTPRQSSIQDFITQDSPFDVRYLEGPETIDLFENKFHYNDFNGKITFSDKGTDLLLSFIHTESFRNRNYVDKVDSVHSNDYLGGENSGLNLKWKQKWNDRLRSNIGVSLSDYRNFIQNEDEKLLEGVSEITKEFTSEIQDVGVKAGLTYYDKNGVNAFGFGYQLDLHDNSIEGMSVSPKKGLMKTDVQQTGYINTLYANYLWKSLEKFSFNMGLRASYYNLSDDLYLEPRLLANYFVLPSLTLKGSYSLHNQFISQHVFFDFSDVQADNYNWVLATETKPPAHSQQGVMGFVYKKKRWFFDVESYWKKIEHLQFSAGMGKPGEGPRLMEGSSNILGVDLLLRKQIGERSNVWTSYSLSKVEWSVPGLNESFDAYYDQRHKVSLGTTTRLGKFSVSSNFKVSSGLPEYDMVGINPPFKPGLGPSVEVVGRGEWHHQLDVSLAYKWQPKAQKWYTTWSAAFYNLYDNQTLLEVREDPQGVYEVYTLGFSFNLQAIVSF